MTRQPTGRPSRSLPRRGRPPTPIWIATRPSGHGGTTRPIPAPPPAPPAPEGGDRVMTAAPAEAAPSRPTMLQHLPVHKHHPIPTALDQEHHVHTKTDIHSRFEMDIDELQLQPPPPASAASQKGVRGRGRGRDIPLDTDVPPRRQPGPWWDQFESGGMNARHVEEEMGLEGAFLFTGGQGGRGHGSGVQGSLWGEPCTFIPFHPGAERGRGGERGEGTTLGPGCRRWRARCRRRASEGRGEGRG